MNSAPADIVDPGRIELLCDAADDAWLFHTIKCHHPRLSKIPDANVRTYQQARVGDRPALERAITPLHQDDRPDWIFCYNSRPILVVEITRHAYTGDNGLQRFARFAAAAENGVPFVYFGPLKRVRDDELDRPGNASPRSLTSDLFEGMEKLSQIYTVPQLYVEWPTDHTGLPSSLPLPVTRDAVLRIHGDLLDTVDVLLFQAPLCLFGQPLRNDHVSRRQERTRILATQTNTRESDVRFYVDRSRSRRLLEAPKSILPSFNQSGYFEKGKPDKLLARYALEISETTAIQLPDETLIHVGQDALHKFLERLYSIPRFRSDSFVYYTGYKWRSDPQCGVLVNLDYRHCRNSGNRDTPLIVLYPRISLDRQGNIWNTLRLLSSSNSSAIEPLFTARYGISAEKKMDACLRSKDLFSLWRNTTKQARLFRRYADLVILNDGLVLGDSLASAFTNWGSR